MAVISSTTSGNWNNTATWAGGVIPVAGDTVTFGGAHTITVPAGYTAECGVAGSPRTAAISNEANPTGVLIVNGTLRVRADIIQRGATWQINYNGTTTFGIVEAPNATSPVIWQQSAAALSMVGTDANNRAILRRGTGGAGFRLRADADTFPFNNRLYGRWALFQNLGTSSDYGVSVENFYGIDFGGGSAFIGLNLEDCVFDGCGPLGGATWNMRSDCEFSLRRVRIKNSLGTYAINQPGASAIGVGGVRLLEDCAFDGTVRIIPGDFTLTRVVVDADQEYSFESTGKWAVATDCVMSDRFFGAEPSSVYGDIVRGFRVRAVSSGANWHGIAVPEAGGALTIDGLIFDGTTSNDPAEGDMIIAGGGATVRTFTVKNCITTKSPAAHGAYGKLVSFLGTSTISAVIENNTCYTGAGQEACVVGVGETYSGFTGQVPIVRSNLAIGVSAGTGTLISRQGAGSTVSDIVTPSGVTNNIVTNPRAASGASGIGNADMASPSAPMFTVAPTAPLDINPQFVDDTRNLASWYRFVVGGTPGTRAADTSLAVTALANAVETPVAGITIIAAYNWIRDGFVPTNTAVKTDGTVANNGWIGAVSGQVVLSNSRPVQLRGVGSGSPFTIRQAGVIRVIIRPPT